MRFPNKLLINTAVQLMRQITKSKRRQIRQGKIRVFNSGHLYTFSNKYLHNNLLFNGFNKIHIGLSKSMKSNLVMNAFSGMYYLFALFVYVLSKKTLLIKTTKILYAGKAKL